MYEENTLRRAEEAAARALELDPNNSQATLTMGLVHYKRGDWLSFWHHAKRAVELERNADALTYLALAYMEGGIEKEARRYGDEAITRDPLSPWALLVSAWIGGFDDDYDGVYVRFRDAAESWASDVPVVIWWTGTAAAFAGREGEAEIWLARTVIMDAGFISDFAELLRRTITGDHTGAREFLETRDLRNIAKTDEYFSFYLAFCLTQIGEADEALEWIEHAISWGFSAHQFYENNPYLGPLHGDPRFVALMERAREQARAFEG
jgi:Tfp pilus assembly protein PilF